MIFETPRLSVRLLHTDDLEPLHEMQSNPRVMRYTSKRAAMSKEETRIELTGLMARYSLPGDTFSVWAVVRKEDGAFAGTCALLLNDKQEREIGYRILEKYWGNGYGKEITEGLIDYAFGPGGLDSLTAYVFTDNIASVRTLEQTRFKLEREFFNEEEGCMDRVYRVTKIELSP